jgi:hypothetical protein
MDRLASLGTTQAMGQRHQQAVQQRMHLANHPAELAQPRDQCDRGQQRQGCQPRAVAAVAAQVKVDSVVDGRGGVGNEEAGRQQGENRPSGSVAEPDHEAIQVIALRDRVPPHPGRAGRNDIMHQEPTQKNVTLQDGKWPAGAPVVTVAEAQ